MNRMKKRALVLALMMLALVVLPVMAMAEAATVTNLTELQTALSQGKNPITLTSNITITGDVKLEASTETVINVQFTPINDLFVVSNGKLTLGKNITINAAMPTLYVTGGHVVIDGAVLNTTGGGYTAALVKSGTIELLKGAINSTGSGGNVTLAAKDSGKIVITGGKVTSTTSTALAVIGSSASAKVSGDAVITTTNSGQYDAAYSEDGGTLEINGGTFESTSGYGVVARDDNKNGNGGKVKITNGTIKGKKKAVIADGNASMTVTGGKFSDDSADQYVAEGLTVEKKNGMWNVVKIAPADVVTNWDAPETGDKENLMMWVALMAMACMGLMVCRRKREN